MELELFTVSYKESGSIGIEFNEQLLQIATGEEIFKEMANEMEEITPIVSKLMMFLNDKQESDLCFASASGKCIHSLNCDFVCNGAKNERDKCSYFK